MTQRDDLVSILRDPETAWAERTQSTDISAFTWWMRQKMKDAATALEAKHKRIAELERQLAEKNGGRDAE